MAIEQSEKPTSKHYSVSAFVVGTFALSWAVWLGLIAAAHLGRLASESLASFYGWGGLGPSLVAFVLTARTDGGSGVKRLAARLLRWRAPLRWYAFALSAPIVIRLLGLALYGATGGTLLANPVAPAAVVIAFLIGLVVPLMEEFGWRGYMLTALLGRWRPIPAGLCVGIVWAVWHLPLFWIEGTGFYRWGQTSGVPLAMLGYSAAVVGLSMLFTLVFCHTDGNLVLAFLLHSATNTSADALFAPYQRLGILGPAWWSVAVTTAAGACACLALRHHRAAAAQHEGHVGQA